MAQKIWTALPQIWGAKQIKLSTIFPRLPHSTPHNLRNEACHQQKMLSVNLQCVPWKLTYFPWPLTQPRLRSVGSLWPTLRRPSCNRH